MQGASGSSVGNASGGLPADKLSAEAISDDRQALAALVGIGRQFQRLQCRQLKPVRGPDEAAQIRIRLLPRGVPASSVTNDVYGWS